MAELDWQRLRDYQTALGSLVWHLDWLTQQTEFAFQQQWSPIGGGQEFNVGAYCSRFGIGRSTAYGYIRLMAAAGLIRRRGRYLDVVTDLLIKPWRLTQLSESVTSPEIQTCRNPDVQKSRIPDVQTDPTPSPDPPSPANPLPNPDPATPPIIPPGDLEAVNDELAALWERVLPGVQRVMMPAHFAARIVPLRPVALDSQTLVLEAPTADDATWVLQRYGAVFRQTLREATSQQVTAVDIRVRGQPT